MNRYDNIPVRLDGDLVKSIDRLQLRSRINAGVRRFLNGQSHVTVAQRIMREKKRGHRLTSSSP